MAQPAEIVPNNPARSFHELTVCGVIQETADARSFVFTVPEELTDLFEYQAGQFLTLEIPWESIHIQRAYSLSSAPESDPKLKVTVKRVDDGRVSNWVNTHLGVGDAVRVKPPAGRFVLASEEDERPLTLFGGGSGITPVISLMKSALLGTRRRMKMVYANRDASSVIFKDELDLLQRLFPKRVELHHHLDSEGTFLSAQDVQALVKGWEESDFYVCGPTPYMDTVEAGLEGLGVDSDRVRCERFVSAVDPDRVTDPAVDPAGKGAATDIAKNVPEKIAMTVGGSSYDIPYRPGQTLLEAALAADVEPGYQCEEGYCACCMAKLVEGEVDMEINDALSEKDIAKGWILACQARPRSKRCKVDFDAH
jgi:3-ketosteroid 9alpha-monooxygenase subunit B